MNAIRRIITFANKFFGSSWSLRTFRAHFGFTPRTCSKLWEIYLESSPLSFKVDHMFYCLFFFKTYPTVDVASSKFNCDPTTYRNWTWKVIYYLQQVMDEIHWDERGSETISTAIDASELPVERPKGKDPVIKALRKILYSGKKKRFMIKYELCCRLSDRKIVWISGPYVGSNHDITIARTSGILNMVRPNEMLLGDKGYIGEEEFLCPIKAKWENLTEEERDYNSKIAKIRVRVEHAFGKLKRLNCLSDIWRHSLQEHEPVFTVCCHLMNLEMRDCDEEDSD